MDNLDVEEMIKKVNTHMTKALMFHSSMIDYFNFLNLWGFKELHQYQYFDESVGKVEFHNNFINQYKEILPVEDDIKGLDIIPKEWSNINAMTINNSYFSSYVKLGWDKYINWEESTKKLYESACKLFLEAGDLTAHQLLLPYLLDVQRELVEVYNIKSELNNCGYDSTYILGMQDKIYNRYHEKMKKLKVKGN